MTTAVLYLVLKYCMLDSHTETMATKVSDTAAPGDVPCRRCLDLLSQFYISTISRLHPTSYVAPAIVAAARP